MLKHLTIRNYALIRQLELHPAAGLNVVTGETGAGKSIMLGALGLLLGNRADTKVLWDENEKCIIEGTFDITSYRLKSFFKNADLDYDNQTVIRREISPGGKSRGFINDTPVTLEVMRSLGNFLMDIHSQHETLQLANQSFQLRLIDLFAGNATLRDEYSQHWERYQQARQEFEDLSKQSSQLRAESDYVKFQLDELVKADLVETEQEQLEAESTIMDNAEEIKSRFQQLLDLFSNSEYAVRSNLGAAKSQLQHLAGFSPVYEALYKRLESARLELEDIADELEKEETNIEFDPQRAEFVKERLSTIYKLQKKHRVNDIRALLELQRELAAKANITENLDEHLAKAERLLAETEGEVKKTATKLSASRKKAFEPLTKQIVKLLKDLGIPNAALEIDHALIEPTSTGADKVELLFSANKGIAPRPLAQVASGGEFSRLMFCIKYVMAEKTAMPTLVLDEIDNGVSGEIALQLGNMMRDMSARHQLVTISHLPQIAAKGDRHFFVYKDNSERKTVSNIRMLSDAERVEEIAKMIGGAKPSKVALENAQELLAR